MPRNEQKDSSMKLEWVSGILVMSHTRFFTIIPGSLEVRSELKAKCMVHNGLVSSSGWHAREGPVVAVI
ncbi:MAG: hypothetical protein ACRD47_12220, partial [Nitrososphaeraceae archaeon]